MQAKQLLKACALLGLAGAATAATAQIRPLCSEVLPIERDFVRRFGGCRDVAPTAPIVDMTQKTEPASAVVAGVPNVVGLSFDDARKRLPGFSLQRSYRASAQPGGTVLEQQPAPPARLAAGATITLVLSDASLRPAPRVSASEVDGVPNAGATPAARTSAATTPAQPPVDAAAAPAVQTASVAPPTAPGERARPSAAPDRVPVPNVTGLSVRDAQARLGRFKITRSDGPSQAPAGRVVGQSPKGSSFAAPGSEVVLLVSSGPARAPSAQAPASVITAAPVVETFEVPNVIGRSVADISAALAEFKVDRVETPSAAPSGQVLAQEPAPGTPLPPGSEVDLQVSDGSLAAAAAAPPVVAAEPAPAVAQTAPAADPASVPSDRFAVTLPSNAVLVLIGGVLLGLMLGAWLMRRWLLGDRRPAGIEPPVRIEPLTAAIDSGSIAPVAAPPAIRFAARLDAGETTVEFAAPPDADEMTLEHSRELHE